MTLTSYGLVVFEWGNVTNVNAVQVLLMTHIARRHHHRGQRAVPLQPVVRLRALAPVMGLLRSDNPYCCIPSCCCSSWLRHQAGISVRRLAADATRPPAPVAILRRDQDGHLRDPSYLFACCPCPIFPISGAISSWCSHVSCSSAPMTACSSMTQAVLPPFIGQNGYILLPSARAVAAPISPCYHHRRGRRLFHLVITRCSSRCCS